MTDHIGEATQKVIDLDALEKLAADLRVEWSERGGTSNKIDGLLKEARQASDGLTALIAELKEARGHLEAMTACSSDYLASGSELARSCKEGMWGELLASARAFLARNGKGEG